MHASLCLFIHRSEQLPTVLLARALEAIVDAGRRTPSSPCSVRITGVPGAPGWCQREARMVTTVPSSAEISRAAWAVAAWCMDAGRARSRARSSASHQCSLIW